MNEVHKALILTRRGAAASRSYSSATLQVPGPLSTEEVNGVPVADLIMPEVFASPAEQEQGVWQILPYLGEFPASGDLKNELVRLFGRQVADYTLVAATAEHRFCRLLAALSHRQEREIGKYTLLVKGPSGWYGIKDGNLMGGPMSGMPINDLDLDETLYENKFVKSTSVKIIEIRRTLANRYDKEALRKFEILYAAAEWDRNIPIASLIMQKPRRTQRTLERIATDLLNVEDPYRYLFRALVPMVMTSADFTRMFGRPYSRGNVQQHTRIKLINKIYMLPFFG